MNKKGEISGLQGIIVTLIIVGLLIGIGFYLLEQFQDSTARYSTGITNETIFTVTEAGENLSYIDKVCDFALTSVLITNTSGGRTINTANYTYTTTGYIYSTGKEFNNSNWNVTYTYTYGDTACEGINDSITALKKIPAWLPLIVIIAILGIVLVIVFKVLPTGRGEVAEI